MFVVGRVAGVACLDNRLYLVQYESNTIRVFAADTLREDSVITVDGMYYPTDIAACRDDHQLYVRDRPSIIWRVSAVNPSDSERWLTNKRLHGFFTLSVTFRRLLLTSQPRSLHQYSTTDRRLLCTVKLPNSVKELTHAVETSRDTFIICHAQPNAVSSLFVHI